MAGSECYCGNPSTLPAKLKVTDSACNLKCPSDPTQLCGQYGGL